MSFIQNIAAVFDKFSGCYFVDLIIMQVQNSTALHLMRRFEPKCDNYYLTSSKASPILHPLAVKIRSIRLQSNICSLLIYSPKVSIKLAQPDFVASGLAWPGKGDEEGLINERMLAANLIPRIASYSHSPLCSCPCLCWLQLRPPVKIPINTFPPQDG